MSQFPIKNSLSTKSNTAPKTARTSQSRPAAAGQRVARKSRLLELASLTWHTRTSPAMAKPTRGQRQQRTMSHPAAGILLLASTQMEQFTLSMSFWIAMNYGTAPMMVPHGVMRKSGIVIVEILISLLTAMTMFISLITTMVTYSIPCMMEHHGQMIGVSQVWRTTKSP